MRFSDSLLGKYKIISTIGSGGFGTVYLAEDTWINKKVALKVPHRQNLNYSELLREPRLLATLEHPNIVAVATADEGDVTTADKGDGTTADEGDGTTAEKEKKIFFIVMEYVNGDTLEAVIAANGALEVDRAVDYSVQIGKAIEYAHGQGVIHRDLRPSNVLVSASGTLKVADFGTSRFLEIAARGTTVIGSPPYMAPEQFQGEAVFASDLYSFGVTMYQMLTGELPYDPPAPQDLHRLRSGELVQPPRLVNGAIPRELDDVVMKALAPQLGDRYGNAGELLSDLDDIRAARRTRPARSGRGQGAPPARGRRTPRRTPSRPRATPSADFCLYCNKPLPPRAARCPFCGGPQ